MAEPWSGQFLQALPTTVLGALSTLGSEFLREWEAQDMRVTLFKLLLLWLVLSLLGIQLAWGFYGSTVTGLYHRPDTTSPFRAPTRPPDNTTGLIPAQIHTLSLLQLWMCSCPQVWAARMDPHLMAPRISLRGKQQQTNLSKPTENKGRQQRDLQGHHRVCWFPHWVLLLPRPQRQRQRGQGWGQGVPQCLQAWASTALRLASSSSRHWASKVCLYPDLGALRRRHAPPSSLRGLSWTTRMLLCEKRRQGT
uniref:T-cell leukemia translocation-altered gene protein isoform X2 n=1 Tax=Halichoerus grypus TaxID=9711 RepID=UPI0016593FF8|nr:T-cell leukemia translocation-altered gene protein isoform X2 [Halichoerus grypus]